MAFRKAPRPPKKPRRPRTRGREKAPDSIDSPAEVLRGALDSLRSRAEDKKRRRKKRRHVDEFRELRLDGTSAAGLPDALLQLTQETYRDRHRLGDDRSRVEIPATQTDGKEGAQALRRQAEQAAREMREENRRLGVKERAHYYSSSERSQTGEIDRTYEIPRPGDKADPDDTPSGNLHR